MTGRERFLTALNNEKPDHLPPTVHSWMQYYLDTYLGGMDQYQAYDHFGMDPVIYTWPGYVFAEEDEKRWQWEKIDLPPRDGYTKVRWVAHTPEGDLQFELESNQFTTWNTEYIIKTKRDFEIWNKYVLVPAKIDWAPVIEAKNRIGDRGIVRSGFFDYGQGSPWQSFCTLHGTQESIMLAMDEPEWMEWALGEMLKKKLRAIEAGGKFELDLVETGGGAGSNTVISPNFHRRFCLPYDKAQHQALHAAGTKVVYHLCGGLMKMLDLVVENGADALETMTPPAMGADCDLAEATRRVGDKLAFIGGFDQNNGFEKGNPQVIHQMVHDLHACCPDGGFICSPSDHFFFGGPENIQAFVNAARECRY